MKNCTILAINSGSSSIKFSLFQRENLTLEGEIENILEKPILHFNGKQKKFKTLSLERALKLIFQVIEVTPDAIGHRVVCGGNIFTKPIKLTKKAINKLKDLTPLAPLHLPFQIKIIEKMQKLYPNHFQVACFDSSFFSSLSEESKTLALPEKYTHEGIIKYGFHGLSYEYICQNLKNKKRGVIAHLGSGASIALIKNNKALDTSMGFSPTSGLIMGTRTGDLDPSIILYLLKKKLSVKTIEDLINHKSGLLGISGISSDMHILLKKKENKRARLAIDLFCSSVRKTIGAFATSVNGLDYLVFTGGIGEKSAYIRNSICKGLGFLGVELDAKKNRLSAPIISKKNARVITHVIPTDENIMIAKHTMEILNAK